ncbi:PPOX class probable FMN-dependent enzyme, alr4036 family [Xenococcus sp. PCC 7305]|uniref:Npun_F5749 family FMN-dependent PPOX-type flavoprotein n=1 Tax=Xenococcus sp. PCC 7305 TaxID=102125 RepID=UPI0002ABD512|nr:FMN-dependent protein [Xenococcus sp. PCC 7305]ELS04846.1 PPOX class probable FMN-dependent enzyme, alr4036 family [Xenococcus sp. PCC 7305]
MVYKLPEWRSHLAGALHRSRAKPHSRYFQLATVSPEGLPKNRTVVFRGFLQSSNQIQIITDSRSDKVSQIAQQPAGEICWYFSKTREQFRFSGNLLLIDYQNNNSELIDARQAAWQKISDNARSQFAWPKPGTTRTDNLNLFAPEIPSDQEPLSTFCLLLFTPHQVDHLQLRGEPQNRCLYHLQSNGDWTIEHINP